MIETTTSRMIQANLLLVRSLLYPSYFSFNSLASLYHITFEEEQQLGGRSIALRKVFLTPVYAAMFILFLPIMCIFLPLRCLLVYIRTPFAYSECRETASCQEEIYGEGHANLSHRKFGIGSANICLMPEVLSKMNHLSNVDDRSEKIGRRISEDQLSAASNQPKSESEEVTHHFPNNNVGFSKDEEVIGHVTKSFPQLDILCVQEAWSSYHNKALMKQLHQHFPYIVHDVGVYSYGVNHFILNSGHLVASKFPFEEIDFKPYTAFVKHGEIISMGLLMIKVRLGRTTNNGKKVGYIFNTHLQSYQEEHEIIPKQLDELLKNSEQFMKDNTHVGDEIAFSIVCGDFNMDNISPADTVNTSHKFFDVYEDFGRIKAGTEKPWTIGTEMRQDRMMDGCVCTPEGLQHALEDPALRQCYVVDGGLTEISHYTLVYTPIKMDDEGNVRVVPEGGRRRIDYINFNKEYPLNVKGYYFVTSLAGLTDHIPIAMEFTCQGVL